MARTKPESEPVETVETVTLEYPKADPTMLIRLGLPYCETCGQQLQRGMDGEPVCPIAKPDCERNVKPVEPEPVTE